MFNNTMQSIVLHVFLCIQGINYSKCSIILDEITYFVSKYYMQHLLQFLVDIKNINKTSLCIDTFSQSIKDLLKYSKSR